MHYLETLPEERPIAAHIYGNNPDSLAEAARGSLNRWGASR